MASLTRRKNKTDRQLQLVANDAPASLTAAAVNVKAANGFQNLRLGGSDWQQEGWLHYDSCPEFHAGVNIIAYNLSRAKLFGVEVDPVSGELATQATDDPDVMEIMREFFGGPTGQSQALDRLGRHLSVAGDSWTLASPNADYDGSLWEILATTDVTGSNGRLMVQQLNGTPREIDTDYELLIRMWRPHPKVRWQADSMTRSLLPVLRELASLTAMVSATIKSRLASSGILWLPEDISLPAASTANTGDTDQQRSATTGGATVWLEIITEAMTAPIRDPDSASAVVPLVALVKGDSIAKIQHMEFGRDLDQTIEPLREACVRRLAVGMDMPPEVLTGLSTANHWSAWTITEEFAKAFLAPLLELICDAATNFYLRPALAARGRISADYAIGFDLSALFPRQLSVDDATLAYNAGILKEEKYLEVLGFSAADMADPQERARRLITEMISRGNPQTIAELATTIEILFPGLKIDTSKAAPPAAAGAVGSGPAAVTAPSGEPTPTPARQAAPARPAPAPVTRPALPPAGG